MIATQVDGGKVHGTYPTDFATLDVGRGRLVPTMPWESMWHAIIDWLGVDVNDADELAHVLPNAANFQTTVLQGWDLLKAEDVFKRTSFAPTLTPVPTLTPMPTNNSLMPEDCADPSIATYDELEAGFSHCTLHCSGVCELRLTPATDFKMEKDLEIMVSGRIYGGVERPTIAPVSDFDAGSYGAFKINAWDNPSMTMTFERLRFAGWYLCGNQPVRRVHRRAVRNRHGHAIEQASRRWREGAVKF